MSLDLFAVLLGGATALLPVYARDILGTGPVGLGLLRSAPAVGALGTSVLLAQRPLGRGIGRTLFRSVLVFGAATVVFGVSRSFTLSLVALTVLGAADVVSMVIRLLARADPHSARHARPGERGPLAVHRHVEPARRLRVGAGGRARRHGAVGAGGRPRHDRGGRAVDAPVPGAAPAARLRGGRLGIADRQPEGAEYSPAQSTTRRGDADDQARSDGW